MNLQGLYGFVKGEPRQSSFPSFQDSLLSADWEELKTTLKVTIWLNLFFFIKCDLKRHVLDVNPNRNRNPTLSLT